MLELEGDHLPALDAELRLGDKVVGRVTSAVPGLALAYVRREVEDGAALELEGRPARVRPRPA